MKILRRGEIVVLESNLSEGVAAYDSAKAYAVGDEMLFEKYIYKALKAVQGTQPITDGSATDSNWQKVRVSNEWAAFDYYLNTTATREGEILLTFSAKGRGLYLNNVVGTSLKIEVLDALGGNVVQSQEYSLKGRSIKSWSDYFFGDWKLSTSRAYSFFFENNHLTNTYIYRVTLKNDNVGGVCEIGSIISGPLKELATSLYDDNSISMLDYSKVTTDEDGNTSLVRGNYKRTNSFKILVTDGEMDTVSYELSQLRGEACVFVISDYFECLTNYAFLKNHEILLSKRGYSIVEIEIEGLV